LTVTYRTITAVPEPTSILAVVMALGLFGRRRGRAC
jgi:hypothetical protein